MPVLTLIGPWPPPFGGVSVHVQRLAAALSREAWSVKVVSAGARSARVGPANRHLGNSPLRHALVPWREAQGIVHLHDRIPVLSAISAAAVRARRLPLVLTVHGEPRRSFSRRAGVDVFLRAAMRMADVTIAVSEDVSAALRQSTENISVLVLPAFLPPSERELSLIEPELLRWIEWDSAVAPLVTMVAYRALPPTFGATDVYGIRETVTLAERLVRGGVSFKLLWLLAMPPRSESERELVQEAVARLERAMGGRFRLVIGAQAAPALARSRVMLRPTIADGDSVAIREALSLGVVVIASDAAPRPSGTIVVPVGDTEGLYRCAAARLRDPVERPPSMASPGSCLEELVRIYTGLPSGEDESTPSAGPDGGTSP